MPRGTATHDPTPASTATPGVVVALAAGMLGAVQPKVNAVLAERVGSTVLASLVNFAAAMAVVVAVLAVRPRTRRLLRTLPSWPVPRWTMTAGLGGVAVVLAGTLAVETIGVAIFSVAFFAGQLTFGLVVDRLGVGSGGVRPIATARVQAALLAVGAVAVTQLGRPVGEFEPGLVALVIAAGATSAFQSAFNGRIAGAVGDPFAATSVNVTVGLSALLATSGVLAGLGRLGSPSWPSEPWLYAGGMLGVTIVLCLAIASAALGVLRATVAMLAAQLVAAVGVDAIVEGEPPGVGVVGGAALIVGAVVLIGRRS